MQKTVTIIIQSQENIEEERGIGIKKLCRHCNKGSLKKVIDLLYRSSLGANIVIGSVSIFEIMTIIS